MLDIAPERRDEIDAELSTDDTLYCAVCGVLMTRGRWRVLRRDAHEHTVFNPAGRVFTIVCFKEAPGAVAQGSPSDEFTWFPGYRWMVAACRGCSIHIGWRYDGADVFFGLIKGRLTDRKP
jgi:hypothetical protein